MKNQMRLEFDSISANEAFARVTTEEEWLKLTVEDQGVGIADVEKAMEPLYTTRPELERSGMGFLFMEAFMDEVRVESEPGKGTVVFMKKRIGCQEA